MKRILKLLAFTLLGFNLFFLAVPFMPEVLEVPSFFIIYMRSVGQIPFPRSFSVGIILKKLVKEIKPLTGETQTIQEHSFNNY